MNDFNILSDYRIKVIFMIKVTASEVVAWWQGCSMPHLLIPLGSGVLWSRTNYNNSKEIFWTFSLIFYFSLSVMKYYLKEKWSCVKITNWFTWDLQGLLGVYVSFPMAGVFSTYKSKITLLKIGKMGQNYLARIYKPSVTCLRKREFH